MSKFQVFFAALVAMLLYCAPTNAQDNISDNGYVCSDGEFREISVNFRYGYCTGLYTSDGKTLVGVGSASDGVFYVAPGCTTIAKWAFLRQPDNDYMIVYIPSTVRYIYPSESIHIYRYDENSAVRDISVDPGTAVEVERYTIDGRKVGVNEPGVNIVRLSDGSVRKELVK